MKKKLPPDHPDVIAEKAAQMPWRANSRVEVYPYKKAIITLREHGYSYGGIAEWLTKELSAPVKRGQVYYVYQLHLAEQDEAFREAEARGDVKTLPSINLSEEEAERKATEEDRVRRKKKP
jgi:hypothetical protein